MEYLQQAQKTRVQRFCSALCCQCVFAVPRGAPTTFTRHYIAPARDSRPRCDCAPSRVTMQTATQIEWEIGQCGRAEPSARVLEDRHCAV